MDLPAPQRASSGSRGHGDSFDIAGPIAAEAANRDNRSDSNNATDTRILGCGGAARAAADSDRIEARNRDPERRANGRNRHCSIDRHCAVNRDDVRGQHIVAQSVGNATRDAFDRINGNEFASNDYSNGPNNSDRNHPAALAHADDGRDTGSVTDADRHADRNPGNPAAAARADDGSLRPDPAR